MGWALIRGWALINFFCLKDGRLFEVALIRGWALILLNTVIYPVIGEFQMQIFSPGRFW